MNAAEKLTFNSFELVLNKFDVFQKAKIFYMGMTDTPQGLVVLQSQLGEVLSGCDFQPEPRIFTPHVTLVRKIKLVRKIEPFTIENVTDQINWQVKQFALVESLPAEGAVEYRPVKFFKCAL